MDLLTVGETAAMLKVNPMTVRRYIQSGRLPAVRIGRQIRVERDAAEALAKPVQLTPAQSRHASRELYLSHRPSDSNIASRKALFEKILANSEGRSIAPLTTGDLIEMAREEDERRVGGW